MTTSDAHEIAAAIREAIPKEQQLRELTRSVADDVCDFAKGLAPVYSGGDQRAHSGEYRDSIHVEELPDRALLPAYRVVTYDRKAWWIEFGTVKWPEHAVFAKTASHFGGTFDTNGDPWDPMTGEGRGGGSVGVTWYGGGAEG